MQDVVLEDFCPEGKEQARDICQSGTSGVPWTSTLTSWKLAIVDFGLLTQSNASWLVTI